MHARILTEIRARRTDGDGAGTPDGEGAGTPGAAVPAEAAPLAPRN
jgi:hypothetical protein